MERAQRERYSELFGCSLKELQARAKALNVSGRSKMNKSCLIDGIMGKEHFDVMLNEFSEEISISVEEAEIVGCESGKVQIEFVADEPELLKVIKPKPFYIDNATEGTLVAFRVSDKMISGKIVKIVNNFFEVETRNGKSFMVYKSNVAWVKTGPRWPKGIYEALKGE
jgi:hypothetical protein